MTPIATGHRDPPTGQLAGDRERFSQLVRAAHGAALSLATRLLGSTDDAEDALQDALLKAWHGLPGLRDPQGFRGWFLRIVYHQCLDARRRRSTRRRHEQAAPPVRPREDERPAQRELLARVRRVLDALPPKQAAALHLRVHEGLEYGELAPILGLTPASARVYVVKARRALRERLGPDGGLT